MNSSSPAAFESFRTIDLRGQHLSPAELKGAMPRAETTFDAASDAVEAIITDVRTRGFTALTDLAQRFDGVDQQQVRVPQEALDSALEQLDPAVRAALETAIERTRIFAKAQRPADAEVSIRPGAVLTHKWMPVSRVGLYVPGGLAVYPSSVVMNVVPAQAAGVESLALASPPQKEFGGLPHPTILAAAKLLGIDEVYAVGGAQAIAAFAYGVQADANNPAILPVDVVTGPGNVFVATAKRLVKGVVGIDSEAGPTEIMVLADDTADARLVAADLVSQAEHDPNAGSVLVTASEQLAAKVRGELKGQVRDTKHSERVSTALSGAQSGVILVDGLEQGIAVCDAYAAEHLEIQTADAEAVAARIRSAGAIFVGNYSPVSLGDYCAGSNHVLPTGGTAAFSSGLNTTTFMRAIQVVNYNREALEEVSADIVALSRAEDLPAHGDAVSIRFE
ncbi:histidinol dehydrogenase [Arthrobacter zhaoxinii]|uniref:Histidinol dehydrogenase n=1 Tax=Arthrobacter zhaoxinii TaxID=2964616 RepID=A0ABY5YT14_9MICC|nr:histidinol dehydrogenase [Arthrobacter zhaoxinii]UWX98256.1 histidinol dehydrogenase [Arthrobacter zhaoxinii]